MRTYVNIFEVLEAIEDMRIAVRENLGKILADSDPVAENHFLMAITSLESAQRQMMIADVLNARTNNTNSRVRPAGTDPKGFF
jgi:hypothetical protein